ncbi:MAG: CopD family protein [Candidatus Thiodiazotropha sp. (ex Codakia rugifera)]|nr:CopD family protein [Candidatus Thiodiazotropha sp. (ex Codakia rugifera)]
MSIAMTLHLLGVIIWVGGMFFAHMILRPVLNKRLEPQDRLPLLVDIFGGFFPWVWAAVITILISGFWMLFTNYKSEIGLWLVIMALVGIVMAAIFMFIYFFPYRQLGTALKNSDKPKSVASVNLIRQLILVNLVLGLLVTVVAIIGKYGLLS